jgi:hypothetical protein
MAEPIFTPINFEEGFKRGEDNVLELKLRRPMAGDLRGLSAIDVIRQEYAAVEKLAPRITLPPMTAQDVASLSPADFMELGSGIADFFMSRQSREKAGL